MPLLRQFEPISFEFRRKLASSGTRILFSAILSASASFAATIYDSGVTSLKASDPVQLGRLSRTNVPSDWSAAKAFPGIVNPTVSYRYETFTLPSIVYPYIQISVDDVSGTAQIFASAYLNAYSPNNTAANRGLDVNYLGDAGFSGNAFGTDPGVFQVLMPGGGNLVLVVNDTSPTGAGIGQPFRLLVEGFISTDFNDAPEPATFGLFAAGLGVGIILARKRNLAR